MLPAGLVLLVVLVAMLPAVWLLQRRLIYFPDAAVPAAGSVLPGAQEITLRTDDGLALGVWHVAPTRADLGITVLVMPGNAGSRAARAPLARRLAAKGFAVLLLDYRGYGGNPGSPSAGGLIKDARAARAYLVGHGVPAQRLIYFGESLGAAVATRLAAEQPPGGLVLRSPFTDLAAVGSRHYPLLPVRLLLRDRFPVTELIGQVRAPTAVVYGSADTIVPPEQSAAVAAAAGGHVRVVEVVGADHNDAALLEGNELAAKGFAVLLLDYRGYGGNPGSPSAGGLIKDARAARAYLVGHGVPAQRLIYFGESLGAAVATRLAAEQPPGGLVLRSPFTDLAAVGSRHYPLLPVRLLLRDRFPVTELIGQVRAPTAVVYGSADTIVPPEQSAAVAAAAGGHVRVVEVVGADHNDAALLEGNELVAAVFDLALIVRSSAGRAGADED